MFALGECGLSPEQFWTLNVREFWIKHAAFLRAENRALWLVAKLALLLNGPEQYKGKPHTPEQLLGYRGVPMLRYPEKPWLKDSPSR